MNNFKKVFRNTLFLTFSEISIKAISLFWTVFLAHIFTVSSFGKYNFVNSFIAIFSFLPDLGIGLIVIRNIAKKKENANLYLGNAFVLNTFLMFVTWICIFFAVNLLGYTKDLKVLIAISTLTLSLSTIRSVGIFFFDGTEKMNISATLNTLNTILLILGGLIGYVFKSSLIAIFIGMALGTLTSLLITWGILLRKYAKPKFDIKFTFIKHLFLQGLPLGIASFSALLYVEIDAVIIKQLLGDRAVGIYSTATPIVYSLVQLLNVPFMVALYPALSRLSENENERFIKAIKKSFIVIISWSIPFAVFICIFAPNIIPVIFGKKYESAVPVLRILIFYVPFASVSALLYKILIVIKKQRYYLYISIFGAGLNILLNILLIPKIFLIGAAISSVSTQLVIFMIYVLVVRQNLILKK